MKILMLTENDPAGVGVLFARAVNGLTGHSCRLVTTQTRYTHGFDKDLHIPWLDQTGLDEVEELLRESDVFHFHLLADEDYSFGPFRARDFMRGKRIVHHHHGHPDFRANPEKYRAKYRARKRDKLLVSTPDLLLMLPEARWIPNLVPIMDPLYTPAKKNGNGCLRVAHSPTRKELKNTDELIRTVEKLNAGSPRTRVELDMQDDIPHRECLERKRRCHALFDHMQGYYGVSSLEGLSQGLPTIAGLDDWNSSRIRDFFGCDDLPWLAARNSSELEQVLLGLARDPAKREEAGRKSRVFMEKYWNEENIVSRLIDFYEN